MTLILGSLIDNAVRAAVAGRGQGVDYVLPEGTGLDLVRESDIDAIVLSAVTDPAVVSSVLRAGAMTYIVKPFAAEVLHSVLRRCTRFLHSGTGTRSASPISNGSCAIFKTPQPSAAADPAQRGHQRRVESSRHSRARRVR